MSIIRNTASGLMKGRVGNTTFYVMNGQQVARQARNNSNYGEGAMRSYAQQARRVKWSNLVNFYKACRAWMPKAFENKKRSQSDYNKFMSVNINSSRVSLTKDQALNGSAVVEPIIVSQGSITPIAQEYVLARNVMTSDIELTITTLGTTPIAQLTQDIITQNPTWSAGDNLALVLFSNGTDERGYPYVQTTYHEFTLDSTSAQPFSSLPIAQFLVKDSATSALSLSTSGIPQFMGACFIHTRKAQSILMTSTQRPVLFNTVILDRFSTQEQLDLAIASYGVSDDVPLDPSFTKGSIIDVKLNGVVNPNIQGTTLQLSEGAVLTIDSINTTNSNLRLERDGNRFQPYIRSGGAWSYILRVNGTYRIYINDQLYGTVAISGVVRPDVIPDYFDGYLLEGNSWDIESPLDSYVFDNNFIYFETSFSKDNHHYAFRFSDIDNLNEDDFKDLNSIGHDFQYSPTDRRLDYYSEANANDIPSALSYKGYIIAVFNVAR